MTLAIEGILSDLLEIQEADLFGHLDVPKGWKVQLRTKGLVGEIMHVSRETTSINPGVVDTRVRQDRVNRGTILQSIVLLQTVEVEL